MIYNSATQNLKNKNAEIEEKIRNKRQAIEKLRQNIENIKTKKEQLTKNINECLKGNKNFITLDKLKN